MGDIIIIEQEENACFLCEEPIHLLVECCNGVEKHKFCSNCFLRQAKASIDGIPLAYGGVGVKCMAICEGAILFARYGRVLKLLDPTIYDQLEDRITLVSLSTADLSNLEKCINCDYAVQIDSPIERVPLFSCQKCSARHCRMCRTDWNIHKGRTCEQVERENSRSNKCHELAERMSEAIIRKCTGCDINFVKTEGCNFMKCPYCSATQCYICKASSVNYSHYCIHVLKAGKCSEKCGSRCFLFDDPNQPSRPRLGLPRFDDGPSTSKSTRNSGSTESTEPLVVTRSGRVSRQRFPTAVGVAPNPRSNITVDLTQTKYPTRSRASTSSEKPENSLIKENNGSHAKRIANKSISISARLERPPMAAKTVVSCFITNAESLSASFKETPKFTRISETATAKDYATCPSPKIHAPVPSTAPPTSNHDKDRSKSRNSNDSVPSTTYDQSNDSDSDSDSDIIFIEEIPKERVSISKNSDDNNNANRTKLKEVKKEIIDPIDSILSDELAESDDEIILMGVGQALPKPKLMRAEIEYLGVRQTNLPVNDDDKKRYRELCAAVLSKLLSEQNSQTDDPKSLGGFQESNESCQSIMLPDSSANDSGIGKSAETSELATLDQSLLLPPTLSPEASPGATCLSVEIDGQRESPLHIEETPGPSHENARTPQSPIIPAALSSFKLQLRPISEASPNSLDPIEPQPDALKQKGGGTADWINLPSGSNSSLPPSADQLELEACLPDVLLATGSSDLHMSCSRLSGASTTKQKLESPQLPDSYAIKRKKPSYDGGDLYTFSSDGFQTVQANSSRLWTGFDNSTHRSDIDETSQSFVRELDYNISAREETLSQQQRSGFDNASLQEPFNTPAWDEGSTMTSTLDQSCWFQNFLSSMEKIQR